MIDMKHSHYIVTSINHHDDESTRLTTRHRAMTHAHAQMLHMCARVDRMLNDEHMTRDAIDRIDINTLIDECVDAFKYDVTRVKRV